MRERERKEKREGWEKEDDAAGGSAVAYRDRRRMVEASKVPHALLGPLIERDRERGGGERTGGEGGGKAARWLLDDCSGCQIAKKNPAKPWQGNRGDRPCSSFFFF